MYDAIADPYCYGGTTVLKNIADIRDQAVLDEFEAAMTAQRADEPLPLAASASPISGGGHPLNLDKLEPEGFLAAMVASFEGDERRLVQQMLILIGAAD